jgi:hypothetical protein
MKSKLTLIAIAAILFTVAPGRGQSTASATDQAKSSGAMNAVQMAQEPTDKEIADAKSKGMVWVNTRTKVYHKEGQYYGKTKRGTFMTEDEAKKAGFRAAQEPVAKKTKTDVKQ